MSINKRDRRSTLPTPTTGAESSNHPDDNAVPQSSYNKTERFRSQVAHQNNLEQ